MDELPLNADPSPGKHATRQRLRRIRRAIPGNDAQRHAQAISAALLSDPQVARCRCIAGYLASDGEVDLIELLGTLMQQDRTVALPTLSPDARESKRMCFRAFDPTQLEAGPYGLLQPNAKCASVKLAEIDLVLMPLVGFDAAGNRLGMGGGFYDRALANHQAPRIGVAHAAQQVSALPVEAHDLPLHGIVTEHGLSWLQSPNS